MESRVLSLTGPSSSPFLFTSYVRPLSPSVEHHLSHHGANLFASLWSSHSPPASAASPPPAARRPAECLLPPEWGSGGWCGARVPQWTFSSSTGQCQSYWYSGCGATSNLFSNERNCRLHCSSGHSGGTGEVFQL